jgi:hypothetical protein
MVSILCYWVIVQVAQWFEASAAIPEPGRWFHYPVGAVFGVLVMGPYASHARRAWRIAGLGAAGMLIYYLSIRFATEGLPGIDAMATFVLAGGISALLVGLAVALIGPRRFAWKLVPLTLAAGAVGGAAFELDLFRDPLMLAAHGAWQWLVCLALHFGFAGSRT